MCSLDMILPRGFRPRRSSQFSFDNYFSSPRHTYQLISGWFTRACDALECNSGSDQFFEAFSFTWFAFNAWGTCVTGVESSDKDMIKRLMQEQSLCQDFAMLRDSSDVSFKRYTDHFSQLWPIFDVRTIRNDRHSHIGDDEDRKAVIKYYLQQEDIRFSPFCWKTHSQHIPVDWPHTLSALYQVRCNLFHGGKIASSEHDREIISSAFNTLAYFLKAMDYFGRHREASY